MTLTKFHYDRLFSVIVVLEREFRKLWQFLWSFLCDGTTNFGKNRRRFVRSIETFQHLNMAIISPSDVSKIIMFLGQSVNK